MRCRWCHNPESWERAPVLAYTAQLCRLCGRCAPACPTGAHRFEAAPGGGTLHRLNRAACDNCGKCVEACPYGALELCGKEYSVGELLAALEQDRPYFGIGEGGGVTLSGGEPMANPDFVRAFLERKGDLHVCVETGGYASAADFERTAPLADLFLFDWKASDPLRHQDLCRADNAPILANLRLLCALGAKVLLRLPLVPGVNDDDHHLRGIAALTEELPLAGAQIMAYHRLGAVKEERFGLEGSTLDLPNADESAVARWKEKLASYGAKKVFI
jgi:pyruvate formate lyase activating enzyme